MNRDRLEKLIAEALAEPDAELVANAEGHYFPYYTLFYLYALKHADPFCVELGVDKGRGSFAMLKGGATVFGVEQNDKECFERKGLLASPKFRPLKCSSTPMPAEIAATEGEIDLLHIDTEHSYTQAKNEFEAYKGKLRDGALVCFDDLNAMEGDVKRYFDELPYEKIVDDRLHPICGYGVLIYRKNP